MHAPAKPRPYWQCLAFAGLWYAAIVLLNLSEGNAPHALLIGVVPWQLILLGLPIFFFLWAVTVVVAYRFIVPITS